MSRRTAFQILLLLPTLAIADTTWVAGGNVQGLWTLTGSPYMIQGNIRIAPATTLSIAPGVEIMFVGVDSLLVEGILAAIGEAQDSIRFTCLGGDSLHRWNGVFIDASAHINTSHCVFEWMDDGGVAVSGEHEFYRCVFRHNRSRAVLARAGAHVWFDRCSFVRNGYPGYGFPGGAIWADDTASLGLSKCVFADNGALDGGAIDMDFGNSLIMYRCVFKNNHAGIWGGVVFANDTEVMATNCTFFGNRAAQGSHLRLVGNSVLRLNSCIFAESRGPGGAIDNLGQILEIRNSDFFGNNPIFLNAEAPAGFNIIDHVNGNGTPCDIYANIFVDPLFADTSRSELELLPTSPCINAGDSNIVWDADGSPPDMGARPRSEMTFVCDSVFGIWDSTGSPYIATCDLVVPAGQTLEIRPGVRVEFDGPYTFFVHGQLTANGTATDSIVFTSDTTVLDQRWQGIQLRPTPHPVGGIFNYCVIENAYYQTPGPVEAGGGVRAVQCNPEFNHCWFRNNRSVDNGGGLAGNESSPVVSYCRFTSNQAVHGGGAVFNGTFPEFYHCIFEHNRGNQGGGIGLWNCSAWVVNCTFAYNHGDDAGGIRSITSALNVLNCIFLGNTAAAGIQVLSPTATPHIIYNSFYQNPQPVSGDGLTPQDYGWRIRLNQRGDSCDAYDNITYDPLLVNPLIGDHRLREQSPCIDAGLPTFPPDPDSSVVDIGAIPYLHEDAWTTLYFPGGFAGIGCPCSYPFQLPEGSLVRLRHDGTHDGPSPDDEIAAQFAISAGAGLPPWDGNWTPRSDHQLPVDSFYVELLTASCCWLSGNLQITASDTAIVALTAWSCHDTGVDGGCLSAAPTALFAIKPPPEPLLAVPNPFNATTELRFVVETTQRVDLLIYDITGRQVAQLAHGDYEAGTHAIHFDGTNLATGIYFVSLRSGSDLTVRKLLFLK